MPGGGWKGPEPVRLRERLSIQLARCHRCARAGCNLCLDTVGGLTHLCDLCHAQEPPPPDQEKAMSRERRQGLGRALAAGVAPDRIVFDPGIGFAKDFEANRRLLRSVPVFRRLGFPVLVRHSRKSFLGRLEDRDFLCGPDLARPVMRRHEAP